MVEIKVKLTEEESNYIERLWFEYNASLNILRFLMSQEGVLEKHLQKYLDSSEAKYTELEMAKKEISSIYKPEKLTGSYEYRFEFDEDCLVYWEKDNEEKN